MLGLEKLGAKVIAIVVLGLVVLGLAALAVSQWRHARTAAAESRVEHAQSGALLNSATDAIATEGAAARRETASEGLTRTNEEEIRNAKGSDAAVDPAARDAGLASLCRRASYRASERCLRRPATP
jgi:Flp pilus assembly protein TadB